MVRRTGRLLALVAFVAAVPSFGAGEPPADQKAKAVEAAAAKFGVTAKTPGVVVATRVKDDTRVFTRGLADLKGAVPITSDTVFELASLSKPFTAVAVLLLHDRGKLDVADAVRKYIPELPEGDPAQPVLISHLLHHTGGLADYLQFGGVQPGKGRCVTNEDLVPEFARQRHKFPARFSPGERFEYSNSGYMLLATVVARASGRPFDEFVRDNVFAPLKMDRSFVYERPDSPGKHAARPPGTPAVGYRRNVQKGKAQWAEAWGCPPRREESVLAVGDGNLWSSAGDMLKWDRAVRERALLKSETWARALSPSKTRDGRTNAYGFGWVLGLTEGRLVGFGHTGDWGGFRTLHWVHDDPDHSAVVLSNHGGFDPELFLVRLSGARR
jgi:CubicO group peptidase (beta-lactamase class C family)